MNNVHAVNNSRLTLVQLSEMLSGDFKLSLSSENAELIQSCRSYLNKKMECQKEPIYGINTGFGALYDKSISNEDLGKLQDNLVMSHACGTGEEVPLDIVKMMLFLKVKGLSYGRSGVQLETVNRLMDMYNNNVLPVVYQQGSLGASGDLAPLAHLSLPLLGMGEVYYKGVKMDSADAMKQLGWDPIELQSKEGLALLNGTQFMSAYGVWLLIKVAKLMEWADIIGAISLDAYDGRIEPFFENVNQIRAHRGQLLTARNFRKILEGSELISRNKTHIQDPYSFRCIPQVHGASKDLISYVNYVFTNEINSVTDNPTIFPEEDMIVSAGNFHGQPLALALDSLAIAVAEMGSISERRTFKLIFGQRNLPPFLVANPGLNSGMMIPQYTQASIVSQNKQLCTPSVVDTIDSSNGQEDHVSMGANAATKTFRVVANLERILAIEMMNASQALEFRKPAKSSPMIETILSAYRKKVSFLENDRILAVDIKETVGFLNEYPIDVSFMDTVS